jgi:DNA-directed RNA polymerase sigma subunit (sigma70/sigma32)
MLSDVELYDAWKKAPQYAKEGKLQALLVQLEGAIMSAVRVYLNSNLPFPILQSEGKRIAVDAIKDYDSTKGMSISSYVITTVKQRLNRYVGQHQNIARIPEDKMRMIGPLREAETELANRLGREATADEVAEHMVVPLSHVTRIRKMMRADILESSSNFADMEQFAADPNYERVMMAYYSLTPDEKLVFDYSMGTHGKKKLDPGEIVLKLGMTSVRVSQIKKQLADKLGQYLA